MCARGGSHRKHSLQQHTGRMSDAVGHTDEGQATKATAGSLLTPFFLRRHVLHPLLLPGTPTMAAVQWLIMCQRCRDRPVESGHAGGVERILDYKTRSQRSGRAWSLGPECLLLAVWPILTSFPTRLLGKICEVQGFKVPNCM